MNDKEIFVRKLEAVENWFDESVDGERSITLYRAYQLLKELEEICEKHGKE